MSQAATAPKRTLPPWWDAVTGRLLALVGAFAFAGIVGSIIIIAYGEDPIEIYRTIWVFSTSEVSDIASCSRDRDSTDLLGPRGRGRVQGRHVQHRCRGSIHRGDGGGSCGRDPADRSSETDHAPADRVGGDARRHVVGVRPRDPQGEDRRPRGRDNDHDERDRDQSRRLVAAQPPEDR